ncbi:MAG TPA: arylesterase [Allosphingosinicella sp.]|nr:arylesterase [Allosphingosinicella sp.]
MIRFWRYVALLLTVQLAAGCASEPPGGNLQANRAETAGNAARPAPRADAKLVLAFGDSLFAGYRLGPNEGLAPTLERALGAAGMPARVVNGAVSGDTTAAGLQRLAFTLDGLERAPDLVIVGLGGNDALRGLGADETRRNLAAILTELRRRRIPVLITGMMAPRNMGPEHAAAFDPIYPALARQFDAELYPFILEGVIARPELLLEDGIHPNARGVEAIVARIGPRVHAALAD